jgi:hypothetical protein
MRLYLQIPAIIVTAFILELMLPWYCIAFAAFLFGYLLNSESNFLGGFIAIALLWGLKIFLITQGASRDLVSKVALIMDPIGESWLLIIVTLIIGGLVGGFAAVAGGALRPKEDA